MAILTNMCMIQDEKTGRVLVQERQGEWAGYSFPGGHIEAGESIYQSVIREVKEETGLDVWDLSLCGVKTFDLLKDGQPLKYVVFCYATDAFSGELLPETSEGPMSWKLISDLNATNVAPGFLTMLPIFFEDYQEVYYDESRMPNYY